MSMTIDDIIKDLSSLTAKPGIAHKHYVYWNIVSPEFHPTKKNGEVWDKILKLRDKVESHSHTRGYYKADPNVPTNTRGTPAFGLKWTRNPTLKAATDALDNFIEVSRDMCDVEQIALTPMGASLFNTIDSYCEKTPV